MNDSSANDAVYYLKQKVPSWIVPGTLLNLKPIYPASSCLDLKIIKYGYPDADNTDELMLIYNHMLAGKPFMFLEWASYDKEWDLSFLDQPRTLNIFKEINGPDAFLIGMNILIQNKVIFLTDNFIYEINHVKFPTEQIRFLTSILPCMKKAM